MKILVKTSVSSFTVTMQSDMLLGLHNLPVCLDNWIIAFSILVIMFKIETVDNAFLNFKTDTIYHTIYHQCASRTLWMYMSCDLNSENNNSR